ncbi:hypothetical protein [Clostridium felsineum]|uniref:Uncharacterized protein n=1 Tax=Clostridium felsineum TaxID=36839 RepID=A0A1S8LJP4_9CLOT|nr:hypothetical protein [Clostridium felsineum]URZ09291.1 hypothetical protein CLROS_047070 [Clostridium felsineum]URZ13977.1 hypothetical protein CROST_047550 [Clostridium felsineum]
MKRRVLIGSLVIVLIFCAGILYFCRENINTGDKTTASHKVKTSKNIKPVVSKPLENNTVLKESSVTENTTSELKAVKPTVNKVTVSKIQVTKPVNNKPQVINPIKSSMAISQNDNNIEKQVKDFILNGQQNLPEAKKIKWSKTFLDKVNINELYSKYIASGGNEKDVKSFAEYITSNAPIQSNWQDLFNEDLSSIYGERAVKLVQLDGDFYQAYVNKDGKEIRFVVVSARTGYFHG